VDELRDEFEGEGAVGIGRRELLRRGAALGAAMAVATPAVQALGRASAFAQASPVSPPPPPPPPSSFTGISYVGLVFTCGGVLYRAKWEYGQGWDNVVTLGGPWEGLPQCPAPTGWDTATGVPGPNYNAPPNKSAIAVAPNVINGELYSVTFTLPSSCTFQDGSGVAKGGNPTNPNSGGFCAAGVAAGNIITYTSPG
jgi:hypothetical protein